MQDGIRWSRLLSSFSQKPTQREYNVGRFALLQPTQSLLFASDRNRLHELYKQHIARNFLGNHARQLHHQGSQVDIVHATSFLVCQLEQASPILLFFTELHDSLIHFNV